ncbi:ABC transporter ATP-binding protein [Leptolyngbya sp. Heron Island J]|uniref:ABC transporter ATP-binding protein n=1 Tax=Leptolyngbya sp. Heron Island J TaxID=1385935 RepID=UPI0004183068|nr:ABC transporter ATP-binding protein [Leptolyngbya sp. Heron Island J]
MADNIAISLENVSKVFKRYQRPADRLKEIFLPGKTYAKEFWALRDISLEIPRGETWGIIGRNGAGKSTLLKIITGTLQPTSGKVQVNGRVSALLELGSGFNPEFTGRQNVFFNGRLLGLNQQEIEKRFEEIVAFADIGDFLEQPVKTYSSGMRARLAFSVASSVNPDVLIVDEVLGVGDAAFQHKCAKRMRNLMETGVTTLFVSHNAGSVKTLCNWSIMMEKGTLKTCGVPEAVLSDYMKRITDKEIESAQVSALASGETNSVPTAENGISSTNGQEKVKVLSSLPKSFRRGSKKATIEEVRILDIDGKEIGESPSIGFNEKVKISVKIRANEAFKSYIVGFHICDRNGNELIATNTKQEEIELGGLNPLDETIVDFEINLPLKPTSYSLSVAITADYEEITSDWIDNAIVFQVSPPNNGKKIHGMVHLPVTISSKKMNSLPS